MDPFLEQLKNRIDDRVALDRKLQMQLVAQWAQHNRTPGASPLTLRDVEFRTFSQNGEDGALLYIFSQIGTTNRTVVEICAGNGIECNAANLLITHGWKGMLVDGDKRNAEFAKVMYSILQDTFVRQPVVAQSWVTAENVNELIGGHGFSGEIDLLSLDIDGVDYWLWKAITVVRPRVVVLEYNGVWKAEHAVTVPYDPKFALDFSRTPYYCGASLGAFAKLGRSLGYRFVGTVRTEINAFFVREDVAVDVLPEVDLTTGLTYAMDYDWGADRPWVAV
jgi:hypothetical protein